MTKEKKIVWHRKGAPEQWGTQPWWVSDEDVKTVGQIEKKVARALKNIEFSLDEELQHKLWKAIDRFLYQTRHLKAMPTTPERRKLMENLQNSAEAFRLSLNDIRDTKIKRTIPVSNELKSEQQIRQLIKTVQSWEQAAKKAAPQTKTGPQSDVFRTELIFALIKIYEEATGKKAQPGYFDNAEDEIKGEFASFSAKILDSIDKQIYWSDRSLVDHILPQAISSLKSTN